MRWGSCSTSHFFHFGWMMPFLLNTLEVKREESTDERIKHISGATDEAGIIAI